MNAVVSRQVSTHIVSVNQQIKQCCAGVAEVCMWLGPSHRQAKHNEKNSGVDGSLTYCGDAQKESENKAFIQVFHPIQSVKSTNVVTLA